MLRVYVAGAYSAPHIIGVMANIRKGQIASLDLLKSGYAPFCPFIDYQFSLISDDPPTLEEYYAYSLAWLEASDAVLVLPGYENSKGTLAEIKRAIDLSIPVYFKPVDLPAPNFTR